MNDIEQRLRDDAAALEALRAAPDADSRLRAAITRAEAPSRRSSRPVSSWMVWLLPMSVAATLAWLMLPGTQETPLPATPPPQVAASTPAIDFDSLQQVSSTAALEAEWEALQADIEKARADLERELTIRF